MDIVFTVAALAATIIILYRGISRYRARRAASAAQLETYENPLDAEARRLMKEKADFFRTLNYDPQSEETDADYIFRGCAR